MSVKGTKNHKTVKVKTTPISILLLLAVVALSVTCKRSGSSGTIDILGPSDETEEAGKLVFEANQDLTKIKILYEQNEGKREELKAAMEKNDAAAAKKIADEVVYLINDGFDFGNAAIKKLQDAQEMNINSDYREYLRLKEESLKLELDAFENYRQAARTLRDNYDPKNVAMRDKVKLEFKSRNDAYREKMEKARDKSNQANELAKAAMRKPPA